MWSVGRWSPCRCSIPGYPHSPDVVLPAHSPMQSQIPLHDELQSPFDPLGRAPVSSHFVCRTSRYLPQPVKRKQLHSRSSSDQAGNSSYVAKVLKRHMKMVHLPLRNPTAADLRQRSIAAASKSTESLSFGAWPWCGTFPGVSAATDNVVAAGTANSEVDRYPAPAKRDSE